MQAFTSSGTRDYISLYVYTAEFLGEWASCPELPSWSVRRCGIILWMQECPKCPQGMMVSFIDTRNRSVAVLVTSKSVPIMLPESRKLGKGRCLSQGEIGWSGNNSLAWLLLNLPTATAVLVKCTCVIPVLVLILRVNFCMTPVFYNTCLDGQGSWAPLVMFFRSALVFNARSIMQNLSPQTGLAKLFWQEMEHFVFTSHVAAD